MMLRILHLSDLHLVKENPAMDALLMYLNRSMDEIQKDRGIDLVIFTGDLIDKGGASFEDINTAFKKFEEVLTILNANHFCKVLDFHFWIRQNSFCFLDSDLVDITLDGDSKCFFKNAGKICF